MKKLLTIFLFCYSSSIYAQFYGKGEQIEDRPLRWADFRGHEALDTFTAIIYTDIVLEKDTAKGICKATYYFYPEKSTVSKLYLMTKPDSSKQRVLDHEQQHYYITKIVTAEFNAILSHFKFDKGRMSVQADSLYAKTIARVGKIQRLYDKESAHSKNPVKQKYWKELIAKAMEQHRFPEDLLQNK